jgi:O-antigen ligase
VGAQLQLRNLQVHDAVGRPLALAASPYRPELWFGGPNGVGHALAASGALAIALAPRFAPALGVWGLGLLAVLLTGSRTAAVALLLGGGGLLALSLPRRRWWWLGVAAALGVALALSVGGETLGRVGAWSWEDRNVLWRIDQMGSAWATLRAYPWTGAPLSELAHNFWLQQAGTLGVPGLLAALWLTGGMLIWALRLRSARAFGVVGTVLLLQVSDISLWFVVVMVPAMWALQQASDGEL